MPRASRRPPAPALLPSAPEAGDAIGRDELHVYEEAEALRVRTPSPEPASPPASPSPGRQAAAEAALKRRRREASPVRDYQERGRKDARHASEPSPACDRRAKRTKEQKPAKALKLKSRSRSRRRRRRKDDSQAAREASVSATMSQQAMHASWQYMAYQMPQMMHPPMWTPPQQSQPVPPPPAGAPPPPPPVPTVASGNPAKPAIPMLHGIFKGVVQIVTPKGALLTLSDESNQRYLDGLLRRRFGAEEQKPGAKLHVKVVRIEAGMVIVDDREVDQTTGKDNDPDNEYGEVEEWVDVPANLVGRIIGKNGTRIRQICDDTGADLRFDEVKAVAAESAQDQAAGTKRKVRGGVGDDMRAFLEAAQDAGAADPKEAGAVRSGRPEGDDLRAFLDDAKEGAPELEEVAAEEVAAPKAPKSKKRHSKKQEVQDGAGDLAAFLQEAKDGDDLAAFLQEAKDGEDEDAKADTPKVGIANAPVAVEFVAHSLDNWDELLYKKMSEAGVKLVYPERLSIVDCRGHYVDVGRGLRPYHFPIRVRYGLQSAEGADIFKPPASADPPNVFRPPASADTADKFPMQEVTEIPNDEKKVSEEKKEKDGGKTNKDIVSTKSEAKARPEAIHISGAERLTKKDLIEVFESKGLPELVAIDHISKSEVVCIFSSATEADEVLTGVRSGFEDVEENECEGPGLWRARHDHLTFRTATTADVKAPAPNRFRQSSAMELVRLRINGDSIDVKNAKKAILAILEECSDPRFPLPTAYGAGGGIEEELHPVPADKIGRLIGKGGENIKKVEAESGAKLRILPAASAPDGGDDAEGEQQLSICGSAEAVEIAKDLVRPFLGGLASSDGPRASGVPHREKTAKDTKLEGTSSVVESLSVRRSEAAEVLERASKRARPTSKPADAESDGGSSSTSSRTRVRKIRDRKQAIDLKEYQLMLQKQRELDAAAAQAEEAANRAAEFARSVKDRQRERHAAAREQESAFDWTELSGTTAMVGRLGITPYGAGRVSRTVENSDGRRWLTFAMLTGGTLQTTERKALSWLAKVEGCLGACVSAPPPSQPLPDAEETGPKQGPPPQNATWVIAEAVVRDQRLFFRLVTATELFPRFVSAASLHLWPRLESLIYLVELCTTPPSVGHVVPFRHDYRKAQKSFAKAEWLVTEGSKPGLQDVGVVKKVLKGKKGEQVAAMAAAAAAARSGVAPEDALDTGSTLRRVLWRCSALDKARREGQLVALERAVLPLLAARLPPGAEALGVGASLDGTSLRIFVRLPEGQAPQDSPAAHATAAAAAAVGALLGCETEVLATTAQSMVKEELCPDPALPDDKHMAMPVGATADADHEIGKEQKKKKKNKKDDNKKKDKRQKTAKKKKAKAASSSKESSSSSSSSGRFLLAMARKGDKALERTAKLGAEPPTET